MSLDPKAATLARELGVLLACYVPDAGEGHTTLELLSKVQEGIQSGHKAARLELPLRRLPSPRRPQPEFDLHSSHALTLLIASSMVSITSLGFDRGPDLRPNISLSFAEDGHLDAEVKTMTGAVKIGMTRPRNRP